MLLLGLSFGLIYHYIIMPSFSGELTHYGGEEIVLLLRNCDEMDALRIAEKIRLKVNAISYNNYPRITLSLGVSSYPKDGKDLRSVIEGSDIAMLRAKQQGKNRTVTS